MIQFEFCGEIKRENKFLRICKHVKTEVIRLQDEGEAKKLQKDEQEIFYRLQIYFIVSSEHTFGQVFILPLFGNVFFIQN